jgi:hypothetical protein
VDAPRTDAFSEDQYVGKSFIPRTRAALANSIPDYHRAMYIADHFERYCVDLHSTERKAAPSTRKIMEELSDEEYHIVLTIYKDIFACDCGHRC